MNVEESEVQGHPKLCVYPKIHEKGGRCVSGHVNEISLFFRKVNVGFKEVRRIPDLWHKDPGIYAI